MILAISIQSCQNKEGTMVSNVSELNKAIENVHPGDVIILRNGIWKDAEVLIKAKGTEDKLIRIKAEENGKVIFTGNSNLRIAGEYIEVSGLVFKDGFSPSSEVISFKEKIGVYAKNCRLTECVITNYSNPDRYKTEAWVAMYGKNNRVDHCSLLGKKGSGVTLTVRLVDEECQNNNHLIDHNYFGHRQYLGANGGESIRVGTSHHSLTNSRTRVVENYFDHCDGEQEIVSCKSCENVFLNNTFFECKGALTFRHGHDNLAEGNFYFGNGVENTGGIRFINERNKAINNYFYELKGNGYYGALVFMNGIVNPPLNRYNQVDEALVSNNTFVNCDHIQFSVNRNFECVLTPKNSKIENNVFYHQSKNDIFTAFDDISGIKFTNNYINKESGAIKGVTVMPVVMKLVTNSHGVVFPVSSELKDAGCTLEAPLATKENTGASWFEVMDEELRFDVGNEVIVEPGLNSLFDAVSQSKKGDILILKDGEYENSKVISINHPLTLKAETIGKPIIFSENTNMITIENGGSLKIQGLTLSGKMSLDMTGNSIISTSTSPMNCNYKLIVKDCTVQDLDVNDSFDFFRVYRSTYADSLVFKNCSFSNITGNIAEISSENNKLGVNEVGQNTYENCTFDKVGGAVLNLLGGKLVFDGCKVTDCGFHKRNISDAVMNLNGVIPINITKSSFVNSNHIKLQLTKGRSVTNISDINIYPKAEIVSNVDDYSLNNLTHKNIH